MAQRLIEAGLRQHQAGRLTEAKLLYEQVLASSPRHPDALHLLGVVALQSGDVARALALIGQAIEVQPRNPGFHANLARAYLAGQRIAEAHAAFRDAAALDPREPRFEIGAANCLALQGRHEQAEAQLRELLQRHPALASAWFNLGNMVREQGRHEDAADAYRHAIEFEPGFADAHMGLGSALHALERFDEAEREYREFLRLIPDSPAGYCNLASALIDVGRFDEAAAVCREGNARSQPLADLYLLLGVAHAHQGDLQSALLPLRKATALAPENARMACSYGSALHQMGQREQGLAWLERALQLQPQSPEFRYAMACVRLSAGDLLDGWLDYESRPSRPHVVANHAGIQLARELPGQLSGVRVCLLAEQGLGDELFFLRFAPALAARGAQISYRASAKLASLAQRFPMLEHASGSDPVARAEITMLLCDLPLALGHPPASAFRTRPLGDQRSRPASEPNFGLPRRVSIFFPEIPPVLPLAPLRHELARIEQRLAALGPPPYLGITWRAGTAPEAQRGTTWTLHKQIPLPRLGVALRDVNGTYLALQRNPKPGEIPELAALLGSPVHDLTDLNENLEAMLALLALMDDYVGVSNTNMHLRAAAGRSARVLVPLPAEWRWMAAGDESPWFPGFRIYRQRVDGDWGAALDRLRTDLKSAFGKRQ